MPRPKTPGEWPVLPGEKLAVVEEFYPGPWTIEEGGDIYSTVTGLASIDQGRRMVLVKPLTRTPIVVEAGDVVIGKVTGVQDKMAIVSIIEAKGRRLSNPFTGALNIAESSTRYERSMMDVCRIGDFVKAKVINAKNRLPILSTIGREFGVIKAFCSKCGRELIPKSGSLHCPNCGNREIRKISSDYGTLRRGAH
ncbi:MAG: exosome complex RNA-binding protein Csl4 [Candidatus Bathyarchaeia archaeon]